MCTACLMQPSSLIPSELARQPRKTVKRARVSDASLVDKIDSLQQTVAVMAREMLEMRQHLADKSYPKEPAPQQRSKSLA